MQEISPIEQPPRRNFFKQALAVIISGIITAVPALAGVFAFLDPLRRKSKAGEFIKVATLDALPPDGAPHKFDVISTRTDAWNTYPNVPIGACYLRRVDDKVTAFNVVCPHAGCFVDTTPEGTFHCPCHNSSFRADGSLVPGSVSPRGLDELDVDPAALKQGVVQVRFMNFLAGTPEKTPRV